MRLYNSQWDQLPKTILFDSYIIGISTLIYLILPFQIYIYRKREEMRDQEQQHGQMEGENQQCVEFNSNYFFDLIFNYFIILLMFTGYISVSVLNR